MYRRNLTPDQLALVMGRHYNRTKKPGGSGWRKGHDDQNEGRVANGSADERIAHEYGVSVPTVRRNGQLAAAVETLKAVNPLAMYRRNLTPDQLALVMGRHYNRTKRRDYSYLVGNQHAKRGLQKEEAVSEATDKKLAKEYGVVPVTIYRNGKFAAAVETLKAVNPLAMYRRNLTPDQLALVMGRHYNRTKKDIGGPRKASPEKQDLQAEKTSYRLAKAYGVGHDTIEKNGKFAAAVEGRQDPEGRNAGGLGGLGGLSRDRRPPSSPAPISRRPWRSWRPSADARRGTPLREGSSLSALSSSKSCA